MNILRSLVGAASLAALLAACAVHLDNAEPVWQLARESAPAGSAFEGWRLFNQRCAACHGKDVAPPAPMPDLLDRVAFVPVPDVAVDPHAVAVDHVHPDPAGFHRGMPFECVEDASFTADACTTGTIAISLPMPTTPDSLRTCDSAATRWNRHGTAPDR